MKRIILLSGLLIVFLIILCPLPVLAFSPPGQGADNATDVIVWHGDNLTLDTTGLNDALVDVESTVNNIGEELFALLVVGSIMALIFWQRNLFLFILGAPVAIIYGLTLTGPSPDWSLFFWIAGVIIAIIGTYCLFKAAMLGLENIRGRKE